MKIDDNNIEIVKMLERQIANNRLSHAYLFQGNASAPKLQVALHFACLLYCKDVNKPCFNCKECKNILNLEHINLVMVKKDGNNIKKEQIQQLQDEFSKTSLVEGKRIYIIESVEKMSLSAANSLLKFLEEPTSENTIAILLTDFVSQVLPTIISRCFVINFKEVKKIDFINSLIDAGIDKDLAVIIGHVTDDKQQALNYDKDDIILLRDLLSNFLTCLSKPKLVIFFQDNKQYFDSSENIKIFVNMIAILFEDLIKLSYHIDIDFKMYEKNYVKYLEVVGINKVKENLKLVLQTNLKFNIYINAKNLLQNLLINLLD